MSGDAMFHLVFQISAPLKSVSPTYLQNMVPLWQRGAFKAAV